MRLSPGLLASITLGDAALVVGVLGLAGVLRLGTAVSTLLIVLGVAGNVLGILRIVVAARRP